MPDWLTGPWGRACLVVVGFVACGALAGVIWNAWWEPPSGVAYQGTWLLDPAGPDVALSGTALYVALAFPVGLLLGVLVSAVPRHEVPTLVGVVVGSALAAWVMYSIGHLLGPPDPRVLAAGEADFTTIPSDLVVATADDTRNPLRSPALLAWPLGAVTGLAVSYLLGPRTSRQGG